MGDFPIQKLYDSFEKETYTADQCTSEMLKHAKQIDQKNAKIRKLEAEVNSLRHDCQSQAEREALLHEQLENFSYELQQEKKARQNDALEMATKEALIDYLKESNEDMKTKNEQLQEQYENLSFCVQELKGDSEQANEELRKENEKLSSQFQHFQDNC